MAIIDREKESFKAYCIVGSPLFKDPDKGYLIPVLLHDNQDNIPTELTNSEVLFPNRGEVFVTTGFTERFYEADEQKYAIYECDVIESDNYEINKELYKSAKYITKADKAKSTSYLQISQVFNSRYPDLDLESTWRVTANCYPLDGFFLNTFDDDKNEVLIGPLDVKRNSIESLGQNNFSFEIQPVNKPLKNDFEQINNVPHSALIFRADEIPNDCLIDFQDKKFLVNHKVLPFKTAELIDLSSKEALIKWASLELRVNKTVSAEELSKFKEIAQNIPDTRNLPETITKQRKSRLNKISGDIEDSAQFIRDFIATPKGQEVLDGHIKANLASLLQTYAGRDLEIKKKENENLIDLELNDKKIELENTKKLIQELELNRIKETTGKNKREEIDQEISAKLKQLKSIENLDQLEKKESYLEEHIKSLEAKQKQSVELLNGVKIELQKTHSTHLQELLKLKMQLNSLSGNDLEESSKLQILNQDESGDFSYDSVDTAQAKVILDIVNHLRHKNRVVDFNQIAILLTSLMQNLVVTLSGKPGAGKSSTVFHLTQTLGLVSSNKYVQVQVQRGWSSDRDILGFYNKLTHVYEPDRYGLYKLIEALNIQNNENEFAVALLDEANLSPIEHYWASFMNAFDNPESFKTQGKESLTLPAGLRFVATVNYDRTTEPLSPRFIDRSPVINIDNQNVDLFNDDIVNEDSHETSLNYSYNFLDTLFNRNEEQLSEDAQRIMREIKTEFQFLDIQQRKARAIKKFTNTLYKVFYDRTSNSLESLDYALLIYLLPQINGQGSVYKKDLERLKDFMSNYGLTRSEEKLKQIIDSGKFESFTFFV